MESFLDFNKWYKTGGYYKNKLYAYIVYAFIMSKHDLSLFRFPLTNLHPIGYKWFCKHSFVFYCNHQGIGSNGKNSPFMCWHSGQSNSELQSVGFTYLSLPAISVLGTNSLIDTTGNVLRPVKLTIIFFIAKLHMNFPPKLFQPKGLE